MPSPHCSQEANDFLARLRNSSWACPINDTCDLGRGKLAEIFAVAESCSSWNEVSIAHLIHSVIVHLRTLGDVKSILEIEALADKELAKVGLAIDKAGEAADVQLKEAFFVLQKAKMSALADRNAYEFQTKPLEAIHSRFGEEDLLALFESSREACKAYISLLCLNFHPEFNSAYQLSSKQVQANIDKAMALNSEFLVSKHSYEKYTFKLQIWQLQNPDYLPSASIKALLDKLLAQYPSGKHGIRLAKVQIHLSSTWKIDEGDTNIRSLIKKPPVLLEDELPIRNEALGIEVGMVLTRTAPLEPVLLDMFDVSCKKFPWRDIQDGLEFLKELRLAQTGLVFEEDYYILLRVAETIVQSPFFFIPEFAHILKHLVVKHREVSSIYEGVNCYHDFRMVRLLKNALEFVEANPRTADLFPFVQPEYERCLENLRKADEAIRAEEGPNLQAHYQEYLQVLVVPGSATLKSKQLTELERYRDELTALHTRLKAKIEAGTISLTYNSRLMDILEENLTRILFILKEQDSKYFEEAKNLFEERMSKINDFYGELESVQLYLESRVEDLSSLQESEELLALLKATKPELVSFLKLANLIRRCEGMLQLFQIKDLVVNQKVILTQLQVMDKASSDYQPLLEKKAALSNRIKTQIEDLIGSFESQIRSDYPKLRAMEHFHRMAEIFSLQLELLPVLEPDQRYASFCIQVDINTFQEKVFAEREMRDAEGYKSLCLTEKFVAILNEHKTRKVTAYLFVGPGYLWQYCKLAESRRPINKPEASEYDLALEKEAIGCRELAKKFGGVDSLIQDFQEQISFDENYPSQAGKVRTLREWLTLLKMAKVVGNFLLIDPSKLNETSKLINELEGELTNEFTRKYDKRFDINFIDLDRAISTFQKWAEEEWKFSRHLPKLQAPSMKTVMAATAFLGVVGVVWYKMSKISK